MELRALRYFVTVAEERHFGRAAERLHIVQPAVSQQIARLERELGTALLDRSPRHVRLTPAGERVLAAARDALAAAERVTAAAVEPGAVLRVGTAPAQTERLERAVDALRRGAPDIEVVLVDLPPAARLDAVREGRLDVALVRGTVAAAELRVEPAWSEPLHAVLSHRHPLAARETVTVADLLAWPLRLLDADVDPPLHDAVAGALRSTRRCPVRGRAAGSVQDLVVELGADPSAWSLLPADHVAASRSRRVRSIPVTPALAVPGGIVTPPSTADACVTGFIAAFADSADSAEPLIS